jgi:hypothetical protein
MSEHSVMHMADPERKGKTLCGVALTGDNAVVARHAQHVTCKRCLAALRRGTGGAS